MSTPQHKKKTPPKTSSRLPQLRSAKSLAGLLMAFKALLRQTHLQGALEHLHPAAYDRLFSPVVTLWYMIFQRLERDHSMGNVLADAQRGGGDSLPARSGRPPLSQRLKSLATTAFSNARQRLPLPLLHTALSAQSQQLWQLLGDCRWHGWRLLLLDGSQVRLRPFEQVSAQFAASSNQRGKAYWVLMRVVVIFCLHTGAVVASAVGSTLLSEQTLTARLMLRGLAHSLCIGDANFGIFWMVKAALQAEGQVLFRLTSARARKLMGAQGQLGTALDLRVVWKPSRKDRKRAGLDSTPVEGRLLAACFKRPGFRSHWVYLFTTLMDAHADPAQELFELYGLRWQVELNLRYLKTQMELNQLACKSAAMAEKEWLAGLMAYNLIRAVMVATAVQNGIPISQLSFTTTRRLVHRWLLDWGIKPLTNRSWARLLENVARCGQARRAKPRPNEPRLKYHIRETFPPLRGSRATARQRMCETGAKS